MNRATKLTHRVKGKLSREALRTYKELRRIALAGSNEQKKRLFIVGCQRSGTSMVTQVFERDLATKIYYEFSTLSKTDKEEKLRLNSLELVKKKTDRDTASLIIMKPLVESQNLVELLNFFPGSKALWMYRHYKDVASSNLKRWGDQNGIEDLRPIVKDDPVNWRSAGASEAVKDTVKRHFAEDMKPHDAAALFWYARNSLYFEQNLARNSDVMICKYEDLALKPESMFRGIYQFVEQPFPGSHITDIIKPSSVGKGDHVVLSPDIETLCQLTLNRLNDAYMGKF